MKKVISIGGGILGMVSMLGIAGASLRNVPPAEFGAPWQSGTSSFDYSNWQHAENTIVNNAGSDRYWVVSIPVDNVNAGVAKNVYGVIANSAAGTTTAQALVNDSYGVRIMTLPAVAATSTTLTDRYLGAITIPVDGTFLVSYIVARSGGKIARTQIDQ